MKKIFALLLTICMVLSLVACTGTPTGGGDTTGENSGNQTENTSSSEENQSENTGDTSSTEQNQSDITDNSSSETAEEQKEFSISDFAGTWESENGDIITIEYIDDNTLVVSYDDVSETIYFHVFSAAYQFINSDRGHFMKDDNIYYIQIFPRTGKLSVDMSLMGENSLPIPKFSIVYDKVE